MLPEGICPRCRSHFCGWALKMPSHQICPQCGVSLEITDDGRHFFSGYSPFTAEEYKIKDVTDWNKFEEEMFGNKGGHNKNGENDRR
jgi:hypothetical protein